MKRREEMKHTFLAATLLIVLAMLAGCSTITVDGDLDPAESATIRLAVGLSMSAEPKTVLPAYAVSTALLTILEGSETTPLDTLDAAINAEADKLNLTDTERASFNELLQLVKAETMKHLNLPEIDAGQKLIIVKTVIQIVREAALARIGA
jgi:hypothetical protein